MLVLKLLPKIYIILVKCDISMENKINKLTSFKDHLNEEYGVKGLKSRDEYEQGFESFKLGKLFEYKCKFLIKK